MIVTFLSWLNVCVCINKRSVKACNVVYWARWSRWCLFMIKFHVVSLCELFLKRQHYACPWHAAYTLLLQPQTVYYRHVIYRLGTVGPLFTAQLLCRSQSRHTRFQMSLVKTELKGRVCAKNFGLNLLPHMSCPPLYFISHLVLLTNLYSVCLFVLVACRPYSCKGKLSFAAKSWNTVSQHTLLMPSMLYAVRRNRPNIDLKTVL